LPLEALRLELHRPAPLSLRAQHHVEAAQDRPLHVAAQFALDQLLLGRAAGAGGDVVGVLARELDRLRGTPPRPAASDQRELHAVAGDVLAHARELVDRTAATCASSRGDRSATADGVPATAGAMPARSSVAPSSSPSGL
jgi:hypothetical protein